MTFNVDLFYSLLVIYPIIFVSTIMHEVGHYLAAIILGSKPKYFLIGSKLPYFNRLNSLIKFEVMGTKFSINPLGLGGLVDLDSYIKNVSIFKIKIMCFCGPLMNLILFYISLKFAIYFYGYDYNFSNFYLYIFISCNLAMFFLNLYPSKKSDGWYIINKNIKNSSSDSESVKSKFSNLVSSEYYENHLRNIV